MIRGHGFLIRLTVPAFHRPRTKQEHFRGDSGSKSVTSSSLMEVTMTGQTQTASDMDETDACIAAAIAACGDDPKMAIRALLAEREILEQRIACLASALSFGYVRGRTGGDRPDPPRS